MQVAGIWVWAGAKVGARRATRARTRQLRAPLAIQAMPRAAAILRRPTPPQPIHPQAHIPARLARATPPRPPQPRHTTPPHRGRCRSARRLRIRRSGSGRAGRVRMRSGEFSFSFDFVGERGVFFLKGKEADRFLLLFFYILFLFGFALAHSDLRLATGDSPRRTTRLSTLDSTSDPLTLDLDPRRAVCDLHTRLATCPSNRLASIGDSTYHSPRLSTRLDLRLASLDSTCTLDARFPFSDTTSVTSPHKRLFLFRDRRLVMRSTRCGPGIDSGCATRRVCRFGWVF
jgi:hypothetical protein